MPFISNRKSLPPFQTTSGFNSSPLSAVVTTYFMIFFIALIFYSIGQTIIIKHSLIEYIISGLEKRIVCNIFPTPDLQIFWSSLDTVTLLSSLLSTLPVLYGVVGYFPCAYNSIFPGNFVPSPIVWASPIYLSSSSQFFTLLTPSFLPVLQIQRDSSFSFSPVASFS